MSECSRFDDEKLARAIAAAKAAARLAGDIDVRVLYRSRRVALLLPAIAAVARIGPADPACLAADARELEVARHLAKSGAPVVGPSAFMPPAPIVVEDLAVTFWPHTEHTSRGYDDRRAIAQAAAALRRVHERFADYAEPLPSYWERIEACGALLCRRDALPSLHRGDRAFLRKTYDRVCAALSGRDVRNVPIHGDAHMDNVFFTPAGALWTDFETACLGPREWDAAALSDPAAFPALDHDLYRLLADLRSVCVIVWCSTLAHDPKKREAAREQLARLRDPRRHCARSEAIHS
ncbi:MAG TPA: phosphotransferase [Roseiarcus sp.]|nr:phosphotransferase [Roseiarcus sp.]